MIHTVLQDANGGLTRTTSPEELESLVATLEHRGLRESALLEALDAKNVLESLRRGERLERRPSVPVEGVQPTRRGKPAKGARAAGDVAEEADVEARAAAAAVACLHRVGASLRKRKLACPEGWGGWKGMERTLAQDGVRVAHHEGLHDDVRAGSVACLRRCAVALEGCMWAVSKDAKQAAKEETPEGSEVRRGTGVCCVTCLPGRGRGGDAHVARYAGGDHCRGAGQGGGRSA